VFFSFCKHYTFQTGCHQFPKKVNNHFTKDQDKYIITNQIIALIIQVFPFLTLSSSQPAVIIISHAIIKIITAIKAKKLKIHTNKF
jgi:competence transcription factor ComK